MYNDHYGLSGRPFQLTPDPRFWFDTATHKKAMAYLGYGLSQGEGFIVITGDPGTGKTTLVGRLMDKVDPERLNVIRIVTTQVETQDLLQLIAGGLGVQAAGMSKAQLLSEIDRGLNAAARAGKRTLLIVDEAQAMPIASLEELRMLSNFQAGGYPLLQIFLLGQPEFRQMIQDSRLDQLRQRVIAMHHLTPMEADEVEPYLIHRLSMVGWRGKPRFTNDAVAAMHRWSDGNPRKLNQLAGRALLYGAIEQIDSFTGTDLENVIADLDEDVPGLGSLRGMAAMVRAESQGFAPPPPAPDPEPTPRDDGPVPAGPAGAGQAAGGGAGDPALAARVASLEARLEETDAALRRVLNLLVEWVERGDSDRPDLERLRDRKGGG